jgi:hypothetical protein
MEPLIDILAQLNESERNDFTSWPAHLTSKERTSVASVLARTTIDRIRTLLTITPEDRIALFLVERNSFEEALDRFQRHRRETNKQIEESPVVQRMKENRKRLWKQIRKNLKS